MQSSVLRWKIWLISTKRPIHHDHHWKGKQLVLGLGKSPQLSNDRLNALLDTANEYVSASEAEYVIAVERANCIQATLRLAV